MKFNKIHSAAFYQVIPRYHSFTSDDGCKQLSFLASCQCTIKASSQGLSRLRLQRVVSRYTDLSQKMRPTHLKMMEKQVPLLVFLDWETAVWVCFFAGLCQVVWSAIRWNCLFKSINRASDFLLFSSHALLLIVVLPSRNFAVHQRVGIERSEYLKLAF